MSTPDNKGLHLTRRRALQGAAWTAPVIVVASAAPAFAVSPGGALDLKRGGSAAVRTTDGVSDYWDLNFSGMSVVVPTALSAGQLTVTVTYTPTTGGGPNGMVVFSAPTGWTSSPSVGTSGTTSVLYTYSSAVTAGSEIQLSNGIHVGGELPTTSQTGTYVVTASAPSLTSDAESFATGGAKPAKGVKAIPRPKLQK